MLNGFSSELTLWNKKKIELNGFCHELALWWKRNCGECLESWINTSKKKKDYHIEGKERKKQLYWMAKVMNQKFEGKNKQKINK